MNRRSEEQVFSLSLSLFYKFNWMMNNWMRPVNTELCVRSESVLAYTVQHAMNGKWISFDCWMDLCKRQRPIQTTFTKRNEHDKWRKLYWVVRFQLDSHKQKQKIIDAHTHTHEHSGSGTQKHRTLWLCHCAPIPIGSIQFVRFPFLVRVLHDFTIKRFSNRIEDDFCILLPM